MKKFFTLLTVVLFLGNIQAQEGFRFGAGAQLIFDGSVFGVQGKAMKGINEQFNFAGGFTIHLEDGVDWSIDLDAHYLLLEVGNEVGFKPFAGLNILKHVGDTEIGINLGAFFDVLKSGDYQFYVEPKLVVGGYDSLVVSGGILF